VKGIKREEKKGVLDGLLSLDPSNALKANNKEMLGICEQ